MSPHIAHVALLIRDYDEAIAYFVGTLGFRLIEDTPREPGKRWVLVAPPGGEAALLLARAVGAEQEAAVGRQGGGRVFLFLHTDDFARDYAAFRARGVRFTETPRAEPYGTVAVFEDLYGNRWDLIQPAGADGVDESVLIGGREPREIVIAEYDPAWPETFEEHARKIREALGSTLLRIEHVGSTSVPGLAAKPIVDILALVPDSADEASYVPHLEAAGYALRVREPDFFEHRMLRTAAHDVHLHVYSPGAPEVGRLLAFRDRLRASAEDRARYEAVKRYLAARSWPDMNAYADAKTEVVESILARFATGG